MDTKLVCHKIIYWFLYFKGSVLKSILCVYVYEYRHTYVYVKYLFYRHVFGILTTN